MTDHTSPEPLPLWQRLNDFAEAYASGDRRLATLKRDALVTEVLGGPMRPQPEAAEPAAVWRCFHCDETFTDAAAARAHFGDSERQQAICTIDAAHFRWMEEQHRRNVDDDSEALRAIGRLTSEHETLRRRAEEEGYARGLRDAKKYPGELGLISIESASTILDYSVAIFEGLGDAAAISTTAEDVQRDIDHLIETKGPKMERFGPLREQGEQLLADTLKLMRKVHGRRVEQEADHLDVLRFRALVRNLGREFDLSTPQGLASGRLLQIRMLTTGCERHLSDGAFDFPGTIRAILDDEIRIQAESDGANGAAR